ncbi:MAG: nucleotidyltransferase family protein [Candidatus Omnitrophica bacterium]|nr:nucleotidyltransferase family protein [Candidatus Omnitrophota bacterium]MDD5611159.1 nucleotidyltransferase family protein [Candidatus Omnitrophota bacterium]
MATKTSLRPSPEARLVLGIANEIIHGASTQEINKYISNDKLDWEKVKQILEYHEISSLAYLILKDYSSAAPPYIIQWLNEKYSACRYYLAGYWDEFWKISGNLQKENIDILPIKGLALLSDVYKPEQARQMRDLDIICKKQDVERSEGVLTALGYQKDLKGYSESYWRNNSCHLIFSKTGAEQRSIFTVELHWSLGVTGYDRNIPARLWDNIRNLSVNGRSIKVLSAEDTFLGLCIHYRRFGRRFSLKNICDIALLLEKYDATLDREYIFSEIKRCQLNSLVYFILRQIELSVGSSCANKMINRLVVSSLRKSIISRFIKNNMFLLPRNPASSFDFFKSMCMKSQILLYDSFRESVKYAFNIPIEVFAQVVGLPPYSDKTKKIYKFRFVFYLLTAAKLLIKRRV